MAYYDNIVLEHRCYPWDDDRSFKDPIINRMAIVTSPTIQPLTRFLEQPDRNFFTANPFIGDDAPAFPFQKPEPYFPTVLDAIPPTYASSERTSSPCSSGPSSSYISSGWSDRQETPPSSRDTSVIVFSPEIAYPGQFEYSYGSHAILSDIHRTTNSPCVALHDIQTYADLQPEKVAFDDEQAAFYASFPQEGYQAIDQDAEPTVNGNVSEIGTMRSDARCPESPNLRKRHAQATRPPLPPGLPSKVTKRQQLKGRTPTRQGKVTNGKTSTSRDPTSDSAFPCPFVVYGCTSTFGSKNEWKRHVNTQHMRTGYWRCDQSSQNERKPNDFNRKDLFIQHVRRMHPSENNKTTKTKASAARSARTGHDEPAMTAIAQRCFKHVRSPPEESGCVFCEAKFHGPSSWDDRLEHIGKHMDAAKKDNHECVDPEDWREDETLHNWLASEGLIKQDGKRWVLA